MFLATIVPNFNKVDFEIIEEIRFFLFLDGKSKKTIFAIENYSTKDEKGVNVKKQFDGFCAANAGDQIIMFTLARQFRWFIPLPLF